MNESKEIFWMSFVVADLMILAFPFFVINHTLSIIILPPLFLLAGWSLSVQYERAKKEEDEIERERNKNVQNRAPPCY